MSSLQIQQKQNQKPNRCETRTDFVNNYIKKKGLQTEIVYNQNYRFINIDITPVCNLSCASCNHFVDTDPGHQSQSMTVDQIIKFCKESNDLKWPWEELRITGGEPTLHTNFFEIIDLIVQLLKNSYLPNLTLKIISNGTGNKVREKLQFDKADIFSINQYTDGFYLGHLGRPDWLVVTSKPLKDTTEESGNYDNSDQPIKNVIPDFGNVWLAPIDRASEIADIYKGKYGKHKKIPGFMAPSLSQDQHDRIVKENKIMDCQVHATCGFELTPYGFTPCPCGGGRTIGDDSIFIKSLREIAKNPAIVNDILKKMCALCGRNLMYSVQCKDSLEKSEFWSYIFMKNRFENRNELVRY